MKQEYKKEHSFVNASRLTRKIFLNWPQGYKTFFMLIIAEQDIYQPINLLVSSVFFLLSLAVYVLFSAYK